MLIVKTLLAKILGVIKADYIIEEGTSGDWKYRKWNRGISECWRNYSGTHSTTGAVMGGYYGSVSFTFPSIFIGEPTVVASGRMGTGVTMVCARDASSSSVTCHYFTNQSGSLTVVTRLYAVGKWK